MEEKLPTFKEIIEDESFIRWVKNNSWQDAELWEDKIKKNPEIRDDAFAAKQFLEHASISDVPVEKEFLNDIWNKINKETSESRIYILRPIYVLIASSAAILAFIIFGLYPQRTSFESSFGEIVSVKLPDDSRVKLNAGSSIIYEENWFNTHRKVKLKGEAFFQVTKGNTFRVVTKEGIITVLGTSFNVKSRDEKLDVICYSGKVKVNDQFKAVYLTKGTKTFKLPGEMIQNAQKSTKDEGINWQKGDFYFQHTPLKEIIAELSRQFNVAVVIPASEEKKVITTSFDNKNIDSALFNILWPLNLNAIKKDGKYFVQKSVIE